MQKEKNNIILRIIELTYFISIFLPIYNSNNIGSYIKLIGNFNIIHLLLLVSLVLVFLVKRNLKFPIPDFLVIMYIMISFLMGFWGLMQGYDDAFIELVWYVIPALFYFIIKYWTDHGLGIRRFLDITYYAMFGNCIFNLVMFLTQSWEFWGFRAYLGTKIGGNYYTVLSVTLPYGFYLLYNKNRRIHPVILTLSTVLSIWCLIMAQSRALLILAVVPCVVLLFQSFNNKYGRGTIRKIIFIFVFIIAGYFLIKNLLSNDSGMGARLASMQIFSDEDTFTIRVYSFIYNFKVFLENIFGRGLGYPLYFYNNLGIRTSSVVYLDNTYMTEAVRGGVFLLIILVWAFLQPLKKLSKLYKATRDKIYFCTLMAYIVFLVNATIMTSQTIHGTAVSIFIWSFISVCINDNSSIIESAIKEGTREC